MHICMEIERVKVVHTKKMYVWIIISLPAKSQNPILSHNKDMDKSSEKK